MQSAPDTVEGSRCGQSIGHAWSIDWPHREWLVGASADCRNRKLGFFSFGLFTIAERSFYLFMGLERRRARRHGRLRRVRRLPERDAGPPLAEPRQSLTIEGVMPGAGALVASWRASHQLRCVTRDVWAPLARGHRDNIKALKRICWQC